MSTALEALTRAQVIEWLEAVKDPEIPVISISELGVLYDVKVDKSEVLVSILPTYSGCPAMHAIQEDIVQCLNRHGVENVKIDVRNKPVWTTDRISKEGRQQLKDYGIAPPQSKRNQAISCPQCQSINTRCISQFGSTACKALYRCDDCLEPFDYFKCHV